MDSMVLAQLLGAGERVHLWGDCAVQLHDAHRAAWHAIAIHSLWCRCHSADRFPHFQYQSQSVLDGCKIPKHYLCPTLQEYWGSVTSVCSQQSSRDSSPTRTIRLTLAFLSPTSSPPMLQLLTLGMLQEIGFGAQAPMCFSAMNK
jgi:hypothetical protein